MSINSITLQKEAIERLRSLLPKKRGTGVRPTIYVTTTQRARSGMSRRLRFFIAQPARPGEHPSIFDITRLVARALDRSMNDDGMLSQGAGMDMHFEAVYALGRRLFDDGYALSKMTL